MTPAHLHVPPEPRARDGLMYIIDGPKIELVNYGYRLGDLLFRATLPERLHWQPSTALQAVGTGVIVLGSLWPWQGLWLIWDDNEAWIRALQSARILFGAK